MIGRHRQNGIFPIGKVKVLSGENLCHIGAAVHIFNHARKLQITRSARVKMLYAMLMGKLRSRHRYVICSQMILMRVRYKDPFHVLPIKAVFLKVPNGI